MSDFNFPEEDLRILKIVTSDIKTGLQFANSDAPTFFASEVSAVADSVADYIKTFKAVPTQRVLLDKHSNDDEFCEKISSIFGELAGVEVAPDEYPFEVDKIRKRFVNNKISELKDSLRFQSNIDAEKTIASIKDTIREVESAGKKNKSAFIQKSLDQYVPEFKKLYTAKKKNPELYRGVPTGYSFLDFATTGMKEAELWIVAGETGAGKSILLNNIAIQMWMQKNTIETPPEEYTHGYNIIYFSLEMPWDQCFERTLSRVADIPNYGIRDCKLTKAELRAAKLALDFMDKYPYKFEIVDIPRGATISDIENAYLEASAKFKPDVVVIDYLGLMEDHQKGADDWLKLGNIAGYIHEFARSYNARVLTAVQLNRAPKDAKKDSAELIGVHRIGRSSLIMHHANVGIQIESRADEDTRSDLVYHIIKNRAGARGKHTVHKKYAHMAIYDIPFEPASRDDYGGLVSGFNDEDDISDQVCSILGI